MKIQTKQKSPIGDSYFVHLITIYHVVSSPIGRSLLENIFKLWRRGSLCWVIPPNYVSGLRVQDFRLFAAFGLGCIGFRLRKIRHSGFGIILSDLRQTARNTSGLGFMGARVYRAGEFILQFPATPQTPSTSPPSTRLPSDH